MIYELMEFAPPLRGTLGYTSWNAEHIEILKREWTKGSTASEIGKMIGKTRNAVIGKAHRLGLESRKERARVNPIPKAPKPNNTPPKPRPPIQKKDRTEAKAKKVGGTKAPVFYAPAAPLAGREPISIMELNVGNCHAIVGHGPDGLATYCGAESFPGKSFCPSHYALYYQPPNERRRA